jgi:hypothetical protein
MKNKLLYCSLIMYVMLNAQNVHAEFYQFDKKSDCPLGIQEALEKKGITAASPTSCWNKEIISYADSEVELLSISLGSINGCIPGEFKTIPVFRLPNNEIVVLPQRFRSESDLIYNLTRVVRTPFHSASNDWSNFDYKEFSSKKVVKRESKYCLEHIFSFPFEGVALQCPNDKAVHNIKLDAYTAEISVVYRGGVMTWEQAHKNVLNECPKYNGAKCKELLSNSNNIYAWNYRGPSANSVIKILNKPEPDVDYYLFVTELYKGGHESKIMVQVFSDGRVVSKPVARKGYRVDDMFRLLNEDGNIAKDFESPPLDSQKLKPSVPTIIPPPLLFQTKMPESDLKLRPPKGFKAKSLGW